MEDSIPNISKPFLDNQAENWLNSIVNWLDNIFQGNNELEVKKKKGGNKSPMHHFSCVINSDLVPWLAWRDQKTIGILHFLPYNLCVLVRKLRTHTATHVSVARWKKRRKERHQLPLLHWIIAMENKIICFLFIYMTYFLYRPVNNLACY